MPLNRNLIGKEYPPSEPFEATAESIAAFAEACGETNPVYRDAEAAKAAGYPNIIAPPTYLTKLNFLYSPQLVLDPELGLDYTRVVHGEQEYEHKRPVQAGDTLVGKAKIADIVAKGKNEILITEASIETTEGELVCIARSTIVSRGTAPQEG